METVETQDGFEFHASARNTSGTGYDAVISNPMEGLVDIVIYQVICHEEPEEPSLSLSLPVPAVLGLLSALQGGVNVALYHAKLSKYH